MENGLAKSDLAIAGAMRRWRPIARARA